MNVMDSLLSGLTALVSDPMVMMWCIVGVTIGTLVSALPGIGTVTAMAILLPLTYSLGSDEASMVLLISIYLGGMYGGRISSILLNIPGDTNAVVATFDGYPLAKQGKAPFALTLSAVASFVGGVLGFIGLAALTPYLADVALLFGPAEYFTLVLFVLVFTAGIANTSTLKALGATLIGLLIATVGSDPISGFPRFTFELSGLWDGVDLVVIAVGLFGVSEILMKFDNTAAAQTTQRSVTLAALTRALGDVKKYIPSMFRGGAIGFIIGLLPGAGASMATFVSYAGEKAVAKDRSQFGNGDPRGLAGPEASDNASVGGSLIPTIALGIPGSAAAALILGGMVMVGLQPGPELITNSGDLVWIMIASVIVANVLLLVMNIVLVPGFALALKWLTPVLTIVIGMLCFIGVYSLNYSMFDVALMCVFGVLGFGLRKFGYPLGNVLLGVILGPLIESSFRQGVQLTDSGWKLFTFSGISIGLTVLTVLSLAVFGVLSFRRRSRGQSKIKMSA
ncbi:tripartite tricarboxylate transporter permease [Dietzia maris]